MWCFSLDDDSHNSGSFLSSPISTAVPKFNDNKPGNLYNSNYLVYYHLILFFIYLVAECLSLFCFSFWYHNFPLSELVCFIKNHLIVRRHQLQIHVQQQAIQQKENSTDTNTQQIRQSTWNAKNIFIYFLAMILCYSPFSIVVIISVSINVNLKVIPTFSFTVVLMNSFINPFLYCWRMTELREAVFKAARLFSCRETDE